MAASPSKIARAGTLLIKKLGPGAILPTRGSPAAAGLDLCAAEETIVPKHGRALVSTQLSIAVPPGHYGRIAPRSGLAWKNFVDVGAGVIDSDYRGEVKVLLFNFSDEDFVAKAGDRIAQFIVEVIAMLDVEEVTDLDATSRGGGGFGSTGV